MDAIRISATVQSFDGVSYYLCGYYFQKKGVRLHRVVWETANGKVPEGFAVHHIDGDRANNALANLALMDKRKHGHHHMQDPDRKEMSQRAIRAAIAKAPEWHTSEEGKAWHSLHAAESWKKRTEAEYTCTHCGKTFRTINRYPDGGNTFCGQNCRAAHRRKSGVDDILKPCERCGTEFMTNKYQPRRICDGCKGNGRAACRNRPGV